MKRFRKLWKQPETHLKLFNGTVPSFEDWALHRSATWRHRVEPVVCFRVALGFLWQLVHVVISSFAVGCYQEFAVPRGARPISPALTVPFSMITFAVSLLLVFKTNSSYSRWWEGRVLWGQIVNYGRNLPRLSLSYAPPPEQCSPGQRALLAAGLRWMAASVHVLRGHLREDTASKCEDEAMHLLTDKERSYLATWWPNKLIGMGHVISWACCHRVMKYDPQCVASMQEQLNVYINSAGGCERILRTPIPSAYTRHTSRFLMIYVIASPVMLWPSLGWATPPVAALIAFLLLGTENIGAQIEEPFHVLPLEAICKGIEAGIAAMAKASLGTELLLPSPLVSQQCQSDSPATPKASVLVVVHGKAYEPAAAAPPSPEQDHRVAGMRDVSTKPLPSQPPCIAEVLGLDHYPEFQMRSNSLYQDEACE